MWLKWYILNLDSILQLCVMVYKTGVGRCETRGCLRSIVPNINYFAKQSPLRFLFMFISFSCCNVDYTHILFVCTRSITNVIFVSPPMSRLYCQARYLSDVICWLYLSIDVMNIFLIVLTSNSECAIYHKCHAMRQFTPCATYYSHGYVIEIYKKWKYK